MRFVHILLDNNSDNDTDNNNINMLIIMTYTALISFTLDGISGHLITLAIEICWDTRTDKHVRMRTDIHMSTHQSRMLLAVCMRAEHLHKVQNDCTFLHCLFYTLNPLHKNMGCLRLVRVGCSSCKNRATQSYCCMQNFRIFCVSLLAVAFSLRVRIVGECLTNHSPPVLFSFF